MNPPEPAPPVWAGWGEAPLGRVTTSARGAAYHAAAFRAADLRKGCPVELRRRADNPHDPNAVALHAPGALELFGYVQRGKVPAVARRLDAGESLMCVSLRGPGPGRHDESALLLIGALADIRAMIDP